MDGVSARDELAEVRITVQGRVQGVGYRWFARERATRLGVAGWASNLPDGSVLVEACGLHTAIEAFIAALREGPPHAHVTALRSEPRASSEMLPDRFVILR